MGAEAGLKNHLQAWVVHVLVHPVAMAKSGARCRIKLEPCLMRSVGFQPAHLSTGHARMPIQLALHFRSFARLVLSYISANERRRLRRTRSEQTSHDNGRRQRQFLTENLAGKHHKHLWDSPHILRMRAARWKSFRSSDEAAWISLLDRDGYVPSEEAM